MAGGFRVDLMTLEEAAAGVNDTIDLASRQQVDDIPFEQSALGNDQLASSVSDFLSGWQRGVNNLVEDGRQIATRLTASANAYRKADRSAQGAADSVFQGTGKDPGLVG
jgi:hypothetical protein